MIERLAYRCLAFVVGAAALWFVALIGLIAIMVALGRPAEFEPLAKLAGLLVAGGLLATGSSRPKSRPAPPQHVPELTPEERRGLLIELDHWRRARDAGTINDGEYEREERRILARLGVRHVGP